VNYKHILVYGPIALLFNYSVEYTQYRHDGSSQDEADAKSSAKDVRTITI